MRFSARMHLWTLCVLGFSLSAGVQDGKGVSGKDAVQAALSILRSRDWVDEHPQVQRRLETSGHERPEVVRELREMEAQRVELQALQQIVDSGAVAHEELCGYLREFMRHPTTVVAHTSGAAMVQTDCVEYAEELAETVRQWTGDGLSIVAGAFPINTKRSEWNTVARALIYSSVQSQGQNSNVRGDILRTASRVLSTSSDDLDCEAIRIATMINDHDPWLWIAASRARATEDLKERALALEQAAVGGVGLRLAVALVLLDRQSVLKSDQVFGPAQAVIAKHYTSTISPAGRPTREELLDCQIAVAVLHELPQAVLDKHCIELMAIDHGDLSEDMYLVLAKRTPLRLLSNWNNRTPSKEMARAIYVASREDPNYGERLRALLTEDQLSDLETCEAQNPDASWCSRAVTSVLPGEPAD